MSSNDICLDKAFLKLFQAEKNATLQLVRKGTYLVGKTGKDLLSAQDYNTVHEFTRLYLNQDNSATNDHQLDVEMVLQQTQALLGEGRSPKEISRLLKIDKHREKKRLELAQAQKKMESAIALDKFAEQILLPIIDNLKFTAAIEHSMRVTSLGFMMMINSLGDNFESLAEKIATKTSTSIGIEEISAVFQRIVYRNHSSFNPKIFLDSFTHFIHDTFIFSAIKSKQELAKLSVFLLHILKDVERRRLSTQVISENFSKAQFKISKNMLEADKFNESILNEIRELCQQIPESENSILPLLDSLQILSIVHQRLKNLGLQIALWKIEHEASTHLVSCSPDVFKNFVDKISYLCATGDERKIFARLVK
jgi:hypothetical protein